MNKKLIAIAVASAMSIPAAVTVMAPTTAQADDSGPTVYGRLRGGIKRTSPDSGDDNIGFEDGSSRFGIKGEEDLGNGLSAVYRYEWATTLVEDTGSSTNLDKRHSWVGLKGSFGQVTIGRQTNPFYGLTGTSYALGNEFTGNYALYSIPGGSDKFSDSLNYRITAGPVEFGAGLILNQDDAANEDLDGFNVAARYNFGIGRVSAAYLSLDGSSLGDDGSIGETDSTATALFVDFNVGSGNVYLGWMNGEEDNSDTDVDSYHVGYGGRSGDVSYFASYDKLDNGDADTDIVTLGGAYYLSGRTRFYFETEFTSADADDSDSDRQVIGIRHDF